MVEVNDWVRMKSYHKLRGKVIWIDPVVDAEGRVIHIMCDGERYRLNEVSVELI